MYMTKMMRIRDNEKIVIGGDSGKVGGFAREPDRRGAGVGGRRVGWAMVLRRSRGGNDSG